jgi:phosphotransferase system IIB component
MSLDGHGLKEIAESTGLHPSTVYRKRTSPGIKDLIEATQQQIIRDNIATIAQTLTRLVHSYDDNKCMDDGSKLEKQHGFKVIAKLAESVGIFPAHTQSIMIQNIYNDNRAELSPIVADLLKSHNVLPDDPIEAELIEDRRL